MKIDRKKNAFRGTAFGIIYRIIQIVFPFIIRTVFIYTLGLEYLGLNSLFTAILQVLNLAELGVSSALVFNMYKPIVEDDKEKICQLLNLYKLYYRIIGIVILVIGLILIPFIPLLIKDTVPSDVNVYVLYVMHLAATVLSYWVLAYKNSLFVAHQRNDIIHIISIIVHVCLYGFQIVVLLLVRNYYVYLSLVIVAQLLINVVTALASKKYYPELKPYGKIPEEERKEINKKVRDLFTAKIGSVINNSADSIVISAVLGLKLLAIYQNYYYIISAIMAIFNIFFSACAAGIGNSLIVKSKEQNVRLLYNINHISFFAINFCCSCFLSLCQPFVKVWVGEANELHYSFVILFAIYLFAEEAPRTLLVFKDAGGIWKHDRFRPLISAGVNLTLNLILTPFIGLYGIVISTIVSFLFIGYPWVIVNINRHLFEIGIRKYVFRLAAYVITVFISLCLCWFLSSFITMDSVALVMIIRLFIATVVSSLVFLLVFIKTEENRYMLQQVLHIKNKIFKRGNA